MWAIAGVMFFALGSIDKNRLEKGTISHKPELFFSHDKALVSDGGSIYWESLIYSADENRRMRVWEEGEDTKIADGFQGTSWTWKYHNLVWIYLIIGGSFLGSLITWSRKNVTAQVAASDR